MEIFQLFWSYCAKISTSLPCVNMEPLDAVGAISSAAQWLVSPAQSVVLVSKILGVSLAGSPIHYSLLLSPKTAQPLTITFHCHPLHSIPIHSHPLHTITIHSHPVTSITHRLALASWWRAARTSPAVDSRPSRRFHRSLFSSQRTGG